MSGIVPESGVRCVRCVSCVGSDSPSGAQIRVLTGTGTISAAEGWVGGPVNHAGLINLVRSSDPGGMCACAYIRTCARLPSYAPPPAPTHGTRLRSMSARSFSAAPQQLKGRVFARIPQKFAGSAADSSSITSLQFSQAVSSINRLITR